MISNRFAARLSTVLIGALLLAGCAVFPPSAASEPTAPGNRQRAITTLQTLQVKGRVSGAGYHRESFQWNQYDADGNGCATRDDVLRRDVTDAVPDKRNSCRITKGTLQNRLSGRAERLPRYRIEIDHVVALYDAWVSGGQQLTGEELRSLANDPLNLIATSHELNQQKGSGDAATWLPPNKSYRCAYVARQIAVKSKYRLWVKPAEKRSMQRILAVCPDEPLPSGTERPPSYPPR